MLENLEIHKYILVALMLFIIGVIGLYVLKRNLIIILMSIELVLLAINLNFIVFSVFIDDVAGEIFSLLILTVAGAESAIGLAILVLFYKRKGIISINLMNYIKG